MVFTPGDAVQMSILMEEVRQEMEALPKKPTDPLEIGRRANIVDKLPARPMPTSKRSIPKIVKPKELTPAEKKRGAEKKRVQYYLGTPIWKKGNLETMESFE
jgi:hypothetical protein